MGLSILQLRKSIVVITPDHNTVRASLICRLPLAQPDTATLDVPRRIKDGNHPPNCRSDAKYGIARAT